MTLVQRYPYRALTTGWIAGRYAQAGTTVQLTRQQAKYERVVALDVPPPPPPPPPPPVPTDPTEIKLILGRATTVRSDATLPRQLALVASEGASGVTWAVDGAGGHVAVVTGATENRLMLTSMPPAGVHDVTVRATAVGQVATAPYRLTIEAVAVQPPTPTVTAPTTVTLSDAAETITTAATLPLTLATLAANGTGPLTWTLVGAPSWATLDLVSGQTALRLTAMPPVGSHTLTLRAANSAGAAQGTFALTVQAAQTGLPFTTSVGTIVSDVENPDGSVTITLDHDDSPGTATLTLSMPTSVTVDGYARMLAPPTVTSAGDTWTVSTAGIYAAPDTDQPDVSYAWWLGGVDTGQTGDSFTVVGAERLQKVELRVRVTNVAAERDGAAEVTTMLVQAEQTYAYAPMLFKRADQDRAEWTGLSFTQDATMAVAFLRFTWRGDPSETTIGGNILDFAGFTAFRFGTAADQKMQFGLRTYDSGGGSLYGFKEVAGLLSGDELTCIAAFGPPMSASDPRRTMDVGIWKNGVSVATLNAAYNQNVVRMTPVTSALIAGPRSGNYLSQDHHRAAVWLGQARKIGDATPLLVKPDFTLQHPAMATAVLGTPLIDLRNGQNYGSLGAPTTITDLT